MRRTRGGWLRPSSCVARRTIEHVAWATHGNAGFGPRKHGRVGTRDYQRASGGLLSCPSVWSTLLGRSIISVRRWETATASVWREDTGSTRCADTTNLGILRACGSPAQQKFSGSRITPTCVRRDPPPVYGNATAPHRSLGRKRDTSLGKPCRGEEASPRHIQIVALRASPFCFPLRDQFLSLVLLG